MEAVILALDDALNLRLRRYGFAAPAWAVLIRCGRTIALGWNWT